MRSGLEDQKQSESRRQKAMAFTNNNNNYLKQYPMLRDEARGNHEADKLAGRAKYCFYNANHLLLSEILPKREQQYSTLLRHVHNIVARVHIASQQLRTNPAYKLDNKIPFYTYHKFTPNTTATSRPSICTLFFQGWSRRAAARPPQCTACYGWFCNIITAKLFSTCHTASWIHMVRMVFVGSSINAHTCATCSK